jgi:hypothetical protein
VLINSLAVLIAAGLINAQPSQVNVSEDLVAMGIARQNAVPGNPNADTRPLFQAAIQYAAANGITRVVADPGAYWFLTPQQPGNYLVLDHVSGLTIDLEGSDIYLLNSFITGIYLTGCQGVTLTNQVRLTGVTPATGTLAYEPIPGWPSPASLQSPDGSTAYWAIVLRGGSPIPNAIRLPLSQPTSSSTLQVIPDSTPWTQPAKRKRRNRSRQRHRRLRLVSTARLVGHFSGSRQSTDGRFHLRCGRPYRPQPECPAGSITL